MKKDKQDAPVQLELSPLSRRHLRFGWWSILFFLTLGVGLESLHAFKVGWYVNAANETRRLMLTLGHAHGVLIGLLHVGFALTLRALGESALRTASLCLVGASVLLPGGFLLGGLVVYGGDPGRGVLLVPVGAVLLFVAVLQVALRAQRA